MIEAGRVAAADVKSHPATHATARMVALVEQAAARLMIPRLRDGESSVAFAMSVRTETRAPTGSDLRAVATHLGVAGRLHHFRVQVCDSAGLLATAELTRVVVSSRRLLALARKRLGLPSMLLEI
jgi:predicted thioesterase